MSLRDLFPEKTLDDYSFERAYEQLTNSFARYDEIKINFRHFKWFDLWALIQLLFLIDGNRTTKVSIYVCSPLIFSDKIKRKTAIDTLRFLMEMEFLERALELGCKLFVQNTTVANKTPEMSIEDMKSLLSESEDTLSSRINSRIIPITRICETLDINSIRESLFVDSRNIFGRFAAEAIVQEAALGDCLLSEIVSNVKVHADGFGYFALRAVGGLRKLQESEDDRYQIAKLMRTKHKLGDWRHYFRDRYNDGFFELIVSDQGMGISSTIRETANSTNILAKQLRTKGISCLGSLSTRLCRG